MFRHTLALLLFLIPAAACAQDPVLAVPKSDLETPKEVPKDDTAAAKSVPVILKNSGDPMRVPFACAEDVLQAAGLLCTEAEPCAIYLELNAVASAGKKVFVAGDLHSTQGTLESILLASDDAGATWKEPAARVPASAFDLIQFHDLDRGWAAGEVQYPLPSDPFVAITSDGGQTWRRSSVSDDGTPGSVLRFWFDSAKHGELIVDAGKPSGSSRYVLWESETAGDTWSLKSAGATVPALKHAGGGGEPVFRIRPAGEKDYLIEKRTGESRWQTVATFLIDVASCPMKPMDVKSELKGSPMR